MTQALAREERYTPDFEAFRRRPEAQGSAWLGELRSQAFARFTELGFPTASHGNERWKYTSVVPIARTLFRQARGGAGAPTAAAELRRVAPWDEGWGTLVFLNGRYTPALSTPLRADGVRIASLAEALAADDSSLREHLARYASSEDDAFVALNTAFLSDGAYVHLPQGVTLEVPVHLLFVSTEEEEPSVAYPRILIVAEPNSRVAVIESYVGLAQGRHFTNAVVEIAVGAGAQVDHYRLLQESEAAFHIGTTRVIQGKDSTFRTTSFSRGATIARNDLHVALNEPGGTCLVAGLYVTSGTQHIDNHINIDHLKPHQYSREYFKGILDGRSKAVFSGRVVVHRGAVKTDARQDDKNLLLSEGAEVDSKPSLEIWEGDVKCGHGATAGQIDAETLFYMRTRGLDHETASKLLIQGFALEIIEKVQVEALRSYLDGLLLSFLQTLPGLQIGKTA